MDFTITTSGVVDRDAAWKVLGDTDALNRLAGNAAVVSEVVHTPEGPRVRGSMTGPMGVRMPFTETGGWIDRQWFRQERVFTAGPLRRSCFEVRLTEEGRGVRPQLTLTLDAPLPFRPLVAANARRIQTAWQQVLDRLPAPGATIPAPAQPLPDAVVHALQAWRPSVDAALFEAVREVLRTGTAVELQSMRPFELADAWGQDRETVLVGMLQGVLDGLFELYWSVRCVRCQGETAASSSLSDLADHGSCPSCQLEFDNDLAANVEVLFAPHPGLLPRVEQAFCSFFPAGSPAIKTALVVQPGTTETVELVVGSGRFTLGAGASDLVVQVGGGEGQQVRWTPEASGSVAVGTGRVELALQNTGDRPARVLLVADDRGLDAVPAALLTTLPAFRRSFAEDVLGPDVRISTRSVTLLFTDLSGSTALFEALGDARAYGLVAEHFRILQGVLDTHRGVLVKTIGDAVMASFHRVEDGFEAALAMREAFDTWTATLDLETRPRLNVGLHVGPALVVHSDAHGLDYFGRTVNLAARAQSASVNGQLTLTEEVLAHPAIAARCAGFTLEHTTQHLKGIGEVRLAKLPGMTERDVS